MRAIIRIFKRLFRVKNKSRIEDVEDIVGRLPEIMQREDVILSGGLAVKQKKITRIPMENLPLLEKLRILPVIIPNYIQLRKSYDNLDMKPHRTLMEEQELKALEDFARQNGVIAIGYTRVDPDDILIDKGILYDNAIVISIEMPADKMKLAPSFRTLKMILETYARTGVVVNRMAALLRRQGFGAQPGPGLGGFTTYPVVAMKAGLGVFVRSGLLMTTESGPSHRLAVVYTNITNLPVRERNQSDWVTDYCSKCGLCIEKCPPGAIRLEPVRINEKHLEYIDYNRCMAYFAQNYGCSICIKVCPFFIRGYNMLREKYLNT